MRKEKITYIYILILSLGFAVFSAWRASLDSKSTSFCISNFAGIFLAGVCLATAMHLLHKVKIRIAKKVSIRKAWLDTLHGAGDMALIAIWGSIYNQLVYVIDDGPVSAGLYWSIAGVVIFAATIVMLAYYCWKEKTQKARHEG